MQNYWPYYSLFAKPLQIPAIQDQLGKKDSELI